MHGLPPPQKQERGFLSRTREKGDGVRWVRANAHQAICEDRTRRRRSCQGVSTRIRKVGMSTSTICQGVYTLTCASTRGMRTSANSYDVYTLSRAWKKRYVYKGNCRGVYTRTWASKRDMCTSANRLGVYTRTLARDRGMYK